MTIPETGALGVVQISDIHIQTGREGILRRAAKIKAAVQAGCHDVSDLLLLITGDVTFSGTQKQFEVALGFVAELEKALSQIQGVRFLGTAVIPGNHDCNFSAESDARPRLLSSLCSDSFDSFDFSGSTVEQLTDIQDEFFSFERAVVHNQAAPTNRLMWERTFSSVIGQVRVRCLNTAWVSRLKEQPGQLLFPLSFETTKEMNDALVISMLHHPYGWLHPDNSKSLRRNLETSSDLIFSGHEHDSDSFARTGARTNVDYVEGGALHTSDPPTGFNFVKINVATSSYEVKFMEWAQEMFVPARSRAAMFARNQALLEHHFINLPGFAAEIENIGTPFSHPRKTQLRLSDLFIYPDLRVSTFDPRPDRPEVIVLSNDVLDFVASKKRLNIAGPPSSGKSALAKSLYREILERKKRVPLLIEWQHIKGTDSTSLKRLIEAAFVDQYPARLLERYLQLDPSARTIVIDDWHKVRLNKEGKGVVTDFLSKFTDNVVVFSDDASFFQQMTEADVQELTQFEHCELRQFGYRLRGELVHRWHTLGREFEVDEIELTQLISASENFLDALIGKGVVPSFPLFIFSVLQTQSASSVNPAFGSYGHIYESLLTTRLSSINKKHLGMKFSYLAAVAHRMFKEKKESLTTAEIREVHREYEREYVVTIDNAELLKEFESAQILTRAKDSFHFQYKYAYYFFVAKFLHDAMADQKSASEITAELRTLADAAYDDDNANVVIFYLYMSKDRELLEHILHNAEGIFGRYAPADLETDVEFINVMGGSIPEFSAPSSNIEKNRAEYRAARDEVDSEDFDEKLERLEEATDAVREVDFAFRSLMIMGQVLRNFPGDLKGDLKIRLAKESYALGLRTMRAFLAEIGANATDFQKYMVRQLKGHHAFIKKPERELHAIAERSIVALCEMSIFGMIKRISSSVGLEELRDVYFEVRKSAGEENIPHRLIDLSIQADHFGNLPENDVEDLKRRLEKNPAAYRTLRLIVGEFLYLFPCSFKFRQKMIDTFSFKATPEMLMNKRIKKLTS